MKRKQIARVLGWRKGTQEDVGRHSLTPGNLQHDSTLWVREDGLRWGWIFVADSATKKDFIRALRYSNDSLAWQQHEHPASFLPRP